MSKQVQFRRGSSGDHAGFTGAVGEITVDTSDNRAVVHDGVTAGGHPLAREAELSNYLPTSYLDTDNALSANSDTKIASQKATKAYALPASYLDTDGTLAANSDTKVPSQKAAKAYVDAAVATVINVSGNAATATALQTARTIDGVSFNGTANITVIAPGTHAASSKATPVDADEVPLVDSAASNVLKRLTWANLKSTLFSSPTLVTPALGTPSSGTLTNCTSLPVSGINASTSTALGVGSIELGHASDTTIARSGAGDITVEGNAIYRAGGTDVPVADGGTGLSSTTAYAVLCGGTTSTAALQSIAGVGTSGQVLTSNGAGALPTFQNAAAASATTPKAVARFSLVTSSLGNASSVNTTDDTVTYASGSISTGDVIYIGATAPGGLTANQLYYARNVGAGPVVQFHPTYTDAVNNTNKINITSSGSGSRTGTAIVVSAPFSSGLAATAPLQFSSSTGVTITVTTSTTFGGATTWFGVLNTPLASTGTEGTVSANGASYSTTAYTATLVNYDGTAYTAASYLPNTSTTRIVTFTAWGST